VLDVGQFYQKLKSNDYKVFIPEAAGMKAFLLSFIGTVLMSL